jgi:hypothetical protein
LADVLPNKDIKNEIEIIAMEFILVELKGLFYGFTLLILVKRVQNTHQIMMMLMLTTNTPREVQE